MNSEATGFTRLVNARLADKTSALSCRSQMRNPSKAWASLRRAVKEGIYDCITTPTWREQFSPRTGEAVSDFSVSIYRNLKPETRNPKNT
jgi:hypothetical protein